MATSGPINLKPYDTKSYQFLRNICNLITRTKDTKLFNKSKDFFFKLTSTIDDDKLEFFLSILKNYAEDEMTLLQAYHNCYSIVPKEKENKALHELFNDLMPEGLKRYDCNDKSNYDSYKVLLEEIKNTVPSKTPQIQSLLIDKRMRENEKLMKLKDILSGHPELFDRVKNQCLVTERDMEHVAHESIPSQSDEREPPLNAEIIIGDFSDNKSNPEESMVKESEIDDEEVEMMTGRAEYSATRINEISPKMTSILYGNNFNSKNFDKAEATLFEKIFKGIKKKCKYDDIVKTLCLYSEGVIGADELDDLLQGYFNFNQDLGDQFMNLIYSREVNRRQNSWFTKPISEFSLSNCEIIDKSYTRFPADFHELICSGVEDKVKDTLNAEYVSVPRGSEYFSFHLRNSNEEALFFVEDERYEMDCYLGNTKATIDSLKKLQVEYDKYKQTNEGADNNEAFVELRNKFVKKPAIKWVKHIYSYSTSNNEEDHRLKFLNLETPVVLQVIITRLEKLYESWNETKKEKIKTKWKKQCRENWEKALDNRSHNFKIAEKKEMTHKVMLKDAKEKFQAHMSGKIKLGELKQLMSTFKPLDYPFPPAEIEDEPMTLGSEHLLKYPEKLPTYRMQLEDEDSFHLALKLVFSIIKFLPQYERHSAYSEGLISLFGLKCPAPDDVSCSEFHEGDRDILISILAPHILNKHGSEDESEHSVGGIRSQNLSDSLTFADIENQTFLELIEQDSFERISPVEEADPTDIQIDPEDEKTSEEKVESCHFIPYYKKEYNLAFGSPNYFIFLKCIFVMYQRLRLAKKIIQDKVEEDYKENKDAVIHAYNGYKNSKERIQENRGVRPNENGANQEEPSEDTIKDKVSRHRLAILVGVAMTKFKGKLDTNTFEDLVRVFLGVNSFFFFTFDKLIILINKSFGMLFNDEYQKSEAFTLFEKYNNMPIPQRSKLEMMYLCDYKSRLNEMSSVNGFTCRVLYSPISKMLSVHYFNLKKPLTNSSLLDDLNNYRDNYMYMGTNEEIYAGENYENEEEDFKPELSFPAPKVFLKRNLKAVQKAQEESLDLEVELKQQMPAFFSAKHLKIRYNSNQTDVIQRKRKRQKVDEKKGE